MNCNPVNNGNGSSGPPRMVDTPPSTQRGKSNAYNIFQDITRGGGLGAVVTMVLNPGLYAVNMSSLGQSFEWRACFRGTFLMGFTVIPQVALQKTTYNAMKRGLLPSGESDELSFGKETVCAGAAAIVSGAATVPGEQFVIKYQGKDNTLSMRQIAIKTYQAGGFRRVFNGGTALAGREWIWVLTYEPLSERMTAIYKKRFENPLLCEVFGAGTAGWIGGVSSAPFNYLRAKKQNQAMSPTKPQSYWHFIRNVLWESDTTERTLVQASRRELFKAAMVRGPVVAVAAILMTQGKKLFGKKEK